MKIAAKWYRMLMMSGILYRPQTSLILLVKKSILNDIKEDYISPRSHLRIDRDLRVWRNNWKRVEALRSIIAFFSMNPVAFRHDNIIIFISRLISMRFKPILFQACPQMQFRPVQNLPQIRRRNIQFLTNYIGFPFAQIL